MLKLCSFCPDFSWPEDLTQRWNCVAFDSGWPKWDWEIYSAEVDIRGIGAFFRDSFPVTQGKWLFYLQSENCGWYEHILPISEILV